MTLSIFISIFTFCVLGSSTTFANESPKTPLFWEIKGGGHTSYILGTVHEGVSIDDLPKIVRKKLARSEVYAMEMDLSKVDRAKLSEWIHLPKGVGLDQMLSTQAWKNLTEILGPQQTPEKLKSYTPWWASFMLLKQCMANVDVKGQLDNDLRKEAESHGLRFEPLENWKVGFAAISVAYPIWKLEKDLRNPKFAEEQKTEYLQIVEAYKQHDLEAVEKLMNSSFDDLELELMVNQRNRAWIPEIERLMSTHHTFITVGGGHLLGEDGIIALLRARGHKVDPLY